MLSVDTKIRTDEQNVSFCYAYRNEKKMVTS